MTKAQLATIVIAPLLLIVLLTAANRWWEWPTDNLRVPVGLAVPLLLIALFSKKNTNG